MHVYSKGILSTALDRINWNMLLSFLMLYTCILFVKINYISERTLRFVVSMYKHVKTKWRRKTFTSTCTHGPDPLHRRLPTGDRVFCLKDAITHEYPTMDPLLIREWIPISPTFLPCNAHYKYCIYMEGNGKNNL